ncbi:N-myristoyltransferase [Tupanvirus soda lake]|uniref:glycylpeptide N-tetradecanoyltransferase n=2 Tax=Tupanvirus TaxID=2094720 RepID=A0A6N1NWP1_9VIRU|nr:N-myristoyltransferase [Tupanvirus soda lake]QKU34702.1 N-myristoyltransferase [Tupanvirus soda lake]
MSYWIDQPFDISNTDTEIKIIKSDIPKKNVELPNGFAFKTLGTNNLEDIYGLLNNHYIEDDQHIVRLAYSKDFLYWYLKYIPHGFVVGLIYKNKLVGVVTACFVDMIIYGKEIKVPYINLLCIQTKIRKLGLTPLLIEELKSRLCNIKMTYALFTGTNKLTKEFSVSKDYVIPINYPKLREVGFLTEDLTPIPKLDENPLHLMTASDIESVVPKLNKYLSKFNVKPYFTNDSAHHFLLPKKNIVYSFVNRNKNGEVTDFISVYKNYLYCLKLNKVVSVAQLSFYFYDTLTLTQLVSYLLDKLPSYGIDQLVFRNTGENMDINITKFSTHGELYYYFYNVAIKETNSRNLCLYPF